MLKPQTKTQLREMIKRKLGAPMIKIELCDDQINDHIDYSVSDYIDWAVSAGTDIVYFTLPLEAGRRYYDLPKGVLDILEYSEQGVGQGGINTLFTMENYLYNNGMFDPLTAYPQSVLGYHMVHDFLETIERYRPDQYNWRYHKIGNQLEITPTPKYGENQITIKRVDPNTNMVKDYILDSPGYVLVKANVIQGSTLPNIIRGWEDVVKEIKSGSETRVVNAAEADNNFFALTQNAIKQELTIYKNGVEYDKWRWYDDNGKMIEWTAPDEILENDSLLLKYITITIEENVDNDLAMEETFEYKTDNITITAIELASKLLVLSEKAINIHDIEITLNGNKYLYGIDFNIEPDDQTINFAGSTLDGLLVDGDILSVKFAGINTTIEEFKEDLYGNGWVIDSATALSKLSLGMIRRKFSQFASIGNAGISLDGDSLVSEAVSELEILKEELRNDEPWEGMYITMG